jgi:hypothetical protein
MKKRRYSRSLGGLSSPRKKFWYHFHGTGSEYFGRFREILMFKRHAYFS